MPDLGVPLGDVIGSAHRRPRRVVAAVVAAALLAACSSTEEQAVPDPPSTELDGTDGPEFVERDVDDVSDARADDATSADESDVAVGDTAPADAISGDTETAAPSDGGPASVDPTDSGSGSADAGGSGSADDTTSPNTPVDDPTALTPEELEAGGAGPVDSEELQDLIDEAEEDFRNRPDAEPGEVALANADLTFETRFFGGSITGTTGAVDVPVGSIVAYGLVTDVTDILTLDGTELREPTDAGSVQLVFRADTPGTFVMLLEDSGTALLEIVVA